jgi:Protein of unknown function (DUF3108)
VIPVARIRALGAVGVLAFASGGLRPARSGAQTDPDARPVVYPVDPSAAPASFGPGERLTYDVKVGWFGVGQAHMDLEGVDTVRGHVTYHARMAIKGGLGPAHVDDDSQSWFDVANLVSWRFLQDIHEVNYRSFRDYGMYPERGVWDRADNGESGPLGSLLPLDDVAFIYFLRTIPMEVGKEYTYHRYFKEDGNPVVVRVVRRDVRKEDSGTYHTIVVKPIIKTRGLFSEGGKAELHFTDDARRILVYLKSDLKGFPGSLTLHLASVEEGLPLNPTSRAEALERRRESGDTARSR